MKRLKLTNLFILVLLIGLSGCDSSSDVELKKQLAKAMEEKNDAQMQLIKSQKELSALRSKNSSGKGDVITTSITVTNSSNYGGEGIAGSGIKASEFRELDRFTEVHLNSSADVNIMVGEKQSVVVRTDDNLLKFISTEVSNKKLIIGTNESYSTQVGVIVDITVSKLARADIRGSGEIYIQGLLGEKFIANVLGSGEIEAKGVVENVEAYIQGSGSIDFAQLTAKKGKSHVTGSGNIAIYTTKSLYAKVTGSGSIRYIGAPIIDSKVIGSGSVSKL